MQISSHFPSLELVRQGNQVDGSRPFLQALYRQLIADGRLPIKATSSFYGWSPNPPSSYMGGAWE